MCEECTKLEERIKQYRRFLTNRFDSLTEERIQAVVGELERRKEAMH